MDKDRIVGAAKEAKGAVKDATGKIIGSDKLQAEGKADKGAGKVQNKYVRSGERHHSRRGGCCYAQMTN